jgi:hypothetical protein
MLLGTIEIKEVRFRGSLVDVIEFNDLVLLAERFKKPILHISSIMDSFNGVPIGETDIEGWYVLHGGVIYRVMKKKETKGARKNGK